MVLNYDEKKTLRKILLDLGVAPEDLFDATEDIIKIFEESDRMVNTGLPD